MSINSENSNNWTTSDAYEAYMGRWSRRLAEKFLSWLDFKPGCTWLDVGCGTGALVFTISNLAEPSLVVACDPSESFIKHAKSRITDPRAKFIVAGTGNLPNNPGGFDCVVSGLVLNFLPDLSKSIEEMRDRTRLRGTLAAYVWDYAGRMEYLRIFWDEVVAMDPSARELDEGVRFPVCKQKALERIFRAAGLRDVKSSSIEIPTHFETFSEYWQPFLGETGPAPLYVASLDVERRTELQNRLKNRLEAGEKEVITLVARAWAIRGTVA
jgi:SAM-dependent methyltransferase